MNSISSRDFKHSFEVPLSVDNPHHNPYQCLYTIDRITLRNGVPLAPIVVWGFGVLAGGRPNNDAAPSNQTIMTPSWLPQWASRSPRNQQLSLHNSQGHVLGQVSSWRASATPWHVHTRTGWSTQSRITPTWFASPSAGHDRYRANYDAFRHVVTTT